MVGLALLASTTAPALAHIAEPVSKQQANAAKVLGAKLDAMIGKGELPQAVVLIEQHGKPLIQQVKGYADLESRTPVSRDAIFRLYSMSKPITSVAAMQLIDAGKLSLDTPVGDVLPQLADLRVWDGSDSWPPATLAAKRPVTILDLLTHTSGISYEFMGNTPVHRYYREYGVGRVTQATSGKDQAEPAHALDELITRLGKAPLLNQPGGPFNYGFSTTVLGALVEKVSGESLDAYLSRHIFKPLEMRDTTFVVSDAQAKRLVTGYMASENGLVTVDKSETSEYRDPSRLRDGGGALAGTLEDYRHFAEMLSGKGEWKGRRIVSTEAVNAMFSIRLRTGGGEHLDSPFGLGLAIGDAGTEARGGLPVGAGSWSGSANTYFFVDPVHDVVAILMTNELTPGTFDVRTWQLREAINRAALSVIER